MIYDKNSQSKYSFSFGPEYCFIDNDWTHVLNPLADKHTSAFVILAIVD